jgi:hypothetical protein
MTLALPALHKDPRPFTQAAFKSQNETILIFDSDGTFQSGFIDTLIVGNKGVFHLHAAIEGDLPVVYENLDIVVQAWHPVIW